MNKISWDDIVRQYENLVKYAAKKVYVQTSHNCEVDSSISPEDLYQVGMINLYDCSERYGHLPPEKFKAVFTTSLFRAVRNFCKPSNGTPIDFESMLEDPNVVEPMTEHSTQELYNDVEELKNSLEDGLAKAILCEIMEPSPRTLYTVWACGARKKCLKEQGFKVNAPKRNDVKLSHIKKSLGVTSKEFTEAMKEIRRNARIKLGDYITC